MSNHNVNKEQANFLKSEDAFRTDKGVEQDYKKKGNSHPGKDKCCPAIKPRS